MEYFAYPHCFKVYALAFPGGYLVRNSACASRDEADKLLEDRQTNGHAFEGEYVVLMRAADYQAAHAPHTNFSCLAPALG